MQTLARVWCALDMASAAGWGGGDAGADLTVLGHAGGFGRKGMCRTAGLGARVLADELSPPRHLVTSPPRHLPGEGRGPVGGRC
ncbi:hypothetical protein SPHINGO391_350022 [Sphingomonas aurantiaca]|uniref:Uncharacterized protein n=1 Tax=Sphingomonas aurantiaca TaxID=185949 RepID=A0A5E7Y4A8_9SPHN|nr:hypothetical protein SPHINGO391_350022 [Sphingomonas aurantiaca]